MGKNLEPQVKQRTLHFQNLIYRAGFFSVKEVAAKLNISTTALSLILHGHSRSPRKRKEIARLLKAKESVIWKYDNLNAH